MLFEVLMLILNVVWFVMIVYIIMFWLINFQVLNLCQLLVWQIWNGLLCLFELIYVLIWVILFNIGVLDLVLLIVFIIIIIVQCVFVNNVGFFYGF